MHNFDSNEFMQQLFFVKKGDLQWREVSAPKISSNSAALVRPFAVAKCDLDDAFLFRDMPRLLSLGNFFGKIDRDYYSVFGKSFFKGPFPFGHECVAEVLEVADGVSTVKPGDVVSVPFQISCGSCDHCSNGNTAFCSTEKPISIYGFGNHLQFGGAMSDQLLVPYADAMLVKIPAHINPIHLASVGDNVADAYRHVAPNLLHPERQQMLIIGGLAKSVALYSVLIAKALGVGVVHYADEDAARCEHAKTIGADAVFSLSGIRDKYDLVVEASSSEVGLKKALSSLKPYGLCSSAGIYLKSMKMPAIAMYGNGTRFVTGLANARGQMEGILSLIDAGKLDLSKVTTRLDKWENCIDAFLSKSSKVVVIRDRVTN